MIFHALYIELQQPDLSEALFANYSKDKASEICKKAGTEGGKAAKIKKEYSKNI
ncbi:hypothetical protein LNP04_06285 [Chryseobacterium sp. C-71]|uniref:hypothetical protein n=1 Tax=Chryseobacterium sp. C-71 TaxID=2893882 RepID=UPI001E4DA2AA|nr:hypothetical protein [Chryseobacterium sp. C-71]UFH33323.1 hypothetical protein LNP04_06285 [Chryseobacterium sp. C-71]